MPLNPVENLPASFTKHNVNVNVNKYIENLKELKGNERLKEGKTEGYKVASSGHVESTVPCYMQPSPHQINKSSKQTEVSYELQLPKHVVFIFAFWLVHLFLYFVCVPDLLLNI